MVDVDVSFVDHQAIKKHLREYSVKNGSPQLAELIGRKPSDNIGFTAGMKAAFVKYGPGSANNLYVTDIEDAYGTFWRCDAKEAITAKARDIKRQIFTALEQFDPAHNAIIHVGMETFDGPQVEQERFLKITDTLQRIELNGKKLRWAYCHFFQSYSHSNEVWTFDETVNTISSTAYYGPPPLASKFLIVPDDEGVDNLAHWERPLP